MSSRAKGGISTNHTRLTKSKQTKANVKESYNNNRIGQTPFNNTVSKSSFKINPNLDTKKNGKRKREKKTTEGEDSEVLLFF